jgi:hypothetical protein
MIWLFLTKGTGYPYVHPCFPYQKATFYLDNFGSAILKRLLLLLLLLHSLCILQGVKAQGSNQLTIRTRAIKQNHHWANKP